MLVFDEALTYEIPRNFRTSRDPYLPSKEITLLPSRSGLYELQAVASAQFSERTLKNAMKKLPGAIYMIDLRKESHVFANGLPISWYEPRNVSNVGLSVQEVLQQEESKIIALRHENPLIVQNIIEKKAGIILQTEPVEVYTPLLETEKQLTERLGLRYARFLVQDHHRPDDETVEQFVQLVKDLQPNTWLYFHCRAGRGRSTTFMVLYDVLKNAKTVSLNDILLRQKYLGGAYLAKVSTNPEAAWKYEISHERKAFVEDFYRYASDPEGYPKRGWREWHEHQFRS